MNGLMQAFLVLQSIGGLGHVVMLATIYLSPKVTRSPTWVNFSITWIVYVVSYILLALAGQETKAAGPTFPLCLAQASLVYGAPVLTSCSALSLIVQVWLSVTAIRNHYPAYAGRTELLIAGPYIAWFIAVFGTFVFGAAHPEDVQKGSSGLYCVIINGVPGYVSSALILATLIIAVFFQARIVRTIMDIQVNDTTHERRRGVLIMLARLVLFIVWGIATIIHIARKLTTSATSQIALFLSHSFDVANVYIACMPLIAFILFASQADILRIWTFRL